MVEFTQLPNSIIADVTTAVARVVDTLDAMVPPTPVVFQNSDTQYVAADVQVPARKPRPATDLDGAERIQSAFAGVPQVPGRTDFAFDPIARIHRHNVMALRLNGQTVVTTIVNWPTKGKFAEALQDATMAANGYSIMSMSDEDLGPMVVHALPALTAVGEGTALDIEFPQANIRLSLETAVEIAKKSQTAGLAKFFVDTFIDFTAMAPVPGAGASAEAQSKMFERLPLPLRTAVIHDINAANTIGRYSGSRSGFLGLSYVQKMGPGFEQKADPVSRPVPVKQAGFGWFGVLGTWLMGLFSARRGLQNLTGRSLSADPVGPGRTVALSVSGTPPPKNVPGTFELADQTRFLNPDSAHVTLPLSGEPVQLVIRRSAAHEGSSVAGNELFFASQRVSRNHAEIKWDPKERTLYVRDLNSKNGITVDHSPRKSIFALGRSEGKTFYLGETAGMVVIKASDSTVTLHLGNVQPPERPRLQTVRPSPKPSPMAGSGGTPVIRLVQAPLLENPSQATIETIRGALRHQLGDFERFGFQVTSVPKSGGGASVHLRREAVDTVGIAGDGITVDFVSGTSVSVAGTATARMASLFNVLKGFNVRVSLTMVSPEDFGGRCGYMGISGDVRARVENGGIVQLSMSRSGMGNTTSGLNVRANANGNLINVTPGDVHRLGENMLMIDVIMPSRPGENGEGINSRMGQMVVRIKNEVRAIFGNDLNVTMALNQIP